MTQETLPQEPHSPAGPAHLDAVKIGLWGPPQSGKTTYLAALTAAIHGNAKNGKWTIFPRGPAARNLKEQFEKALADDLLFPESTAGVTVPLEWLFVGRLSGSRFDRRLLRGVPGRSELESRFMLDLIDIHGSAYSREPGQPGAAGAPVSDEVISAVFDHLADSQGIIFLFDPIGEQKNRNSATHMRGTVNELLLRAASNGRRPGWYLHHQVSVCITKFDDPELFQQARKMNLVTKDPDNGMPRVRDHDAEKFFDELCSGKFWDRPPEGGQQSAEYVRDQIRELFDPKRVRYFVTSSIGFAMEPPTGAEVAAQFDLNAHSNYLERDGLPGIKGKVRPINVLEPLISLQQRIVKG